MSKFKLVNLCFFIAMLTCCVLAYMSHVNSKSAQEFHAELTDIGHKLIEERDVIVNRYAVEDRKNYELTTSLVDIEVARSSGGRGRAMGALTAGASSVTKPIAAPRSRPI